MILKLFGSTSVFEKFHIYRAFVLLFIFKSNLLFTLKFEKYSFISEALKLVELAPIQMNIA